MNTEPEVTNNNNILDSLNASCIMHAETLQVLTKCQTQIEKIFKIISLIDKGIFLNIVHLIDFIWYIIYICKKIPP